MADPPTPGSPSSGRHKIFARRVLTTLIKAPCILPAVIRSNVKHLETPAENHQPTKTSGPPLNHGTLAPLSLDYPTLSQELQYELSAWFHELQWKHARLATMNTKRLGAWLIDSPELEFRLPNALDVRVTVESTSPFGRPDKILVRGFFGSRNSKTRRLFGSRPPNFKNNIFRQFRDALALLSDEEP
ncbi:hypothetical protein Pst134EB_020102 [Puccinia striiformis f. sp. tritici]|nr:hypothetical protein Pst134EB_020102 [Puccinia striiformis f. sp. tritici]